MDLSRANNGHVSSPVCAVKPTGSSETPYTERTVNNERLGIFSDSGLVGKAVI